jgi:curved DNA-binding protein CbpA
VQVNEACKILGCSPGSTLAEIKNRYRALLFRYHPDVSKLPPNQSFEKTSAVISAYGVLAESHQKREKDERKRIAHLYRTLFNLDLHSDTPGLDQIKPFFLSAGNIIYPDNSSTSRKICLEYFASSASGSTGLPGRLVHSLANGLLQLLETRLSVLNFGGHEEYSLEVTRRELLQWFSDITTAGDYFSFRMAMFSTLDGLKARLGRELLTSKNDLYRQELLLYWYLVTVLSEEKHVAEWTGTRGLDT